MTDPTEKTPELRPTPRVTVDHRPGRWGKVFHLFDLDKREIALQEKDAIALARTILRISNKLKVKK